MKGKVSCLFVVCLGLASLQYGVAAPAGKRVSVPTPVAATADSKPFERFMLPEIVLEEQTLETAFNRLKSVYGEVCTQTGEPPVALSFVVPESGHRLSKIKLAGLDLHGQCFCWPVSVA